MARKRSGPPPKVRKQWMQFHRSQSMGNGTSRTHKLPDYVLDKMKADKKQVGTYFDLWIGIGREWGKVTLL